MALRVEAQALAPREREEHGPPGLQCEQGRVPLDVQVLFRAECAAGRDLRHPHQLLRQAEERRDLPPVLPDPLALRVDLEPSVLVRNGKCGLGLEEGVLDALRAVGLLHDVCRTRERGVDVSALHPRDREHVAALVQPRRGRVHRLERVGHRLEDLVLDVDEGRRLVRRVARLGGDGGEHVADVRRRLALGDELSPVLGQRPLRALAGDVRRGQHGDDAGMSLGSRRVDAQDASAGMVREAKDPVQHLRCDEVAHERLVAERELIAFVASRTGADSAREVQLGQRLAAASPCVELDRVDDLHVARAAAEIAEERPGDLLPRRLRVLSQEPLGLHDDPG